MITALGRLTKSKTEEKRKVPQKTGDTFDARKEAERLNKEAERLETEAELAFNEIRKMGFLKGFFQKYGMNSRDVISHLTK